MKSKKNFWQDPAQKQMRIMLAGGAALLLINVLAAMHSSPKPNDQVTAKPSQFSKSQPVKAESASVQYLTIKEWGVRVPLKPELSGLTYYIKNDEARFSLPSLEAAGCSAKSVGLPVGLQRTHAQIIATTETRPTTEPSFKHIDNQWFSISGAGAMCFDRPPESLSPSTLTTYNQAAAAIGLVLRRLQSE
ncbi:MAG: hypothetical protein JWS12_179 [Candidatus Saccharibacteria bacterium]|nr:hypothetical protein [Candidatus Saccharibacteria bacterium]